MSDIVLPESILSQQEEDARSIRLRVMLALIENRSDIDTANLVSTADPIVQYIRRGNKAE